MEAYPRNTVATFSHPCSRQDGRTRAGRWVGKGRHTTATAQHVLLQYSEYMAALYMQLPHHTWAAASLLGTEWVSLHPLRSGHGSLHPLRSGHGSLHPLRSGHGSLHPLRSMLVAIGCMRSFKVHQVHVFLCGTNEHEL